MTSPEAFADATGTVRGQSFRGIAAAGVTGPEDGEFIGCDFTGADFTGAHLSGLTFRDCTFEKTVLHEARLTETRFLKCRSFAGAVFGGARADGLVMEDCDLSEVDFRAAVLRNSDFTGSKLYRANFEAADLSGYTGVTADETRFYKATLTPRKATWLERSFGTHREPWSTLRLRFTGLNLFLSILPGAFYVASLLIGAVLEMLARIVANPVTYLQECVLPLTSTGLCESKPLIHYVSGWNEGFLPGLFVTFALLHNIARAHVTINVSALAAQEDLNGRTPPHAKFATLRRLSLGLTVSQTVMLGLFAVSLAELLFTPIPLPQLPPAN